MGAAALLALFCCYYSLICASPPPHPPLLEPSHHYFKYCKISALALLKMVMHARSGGNLEVMGLMLGKVDGETMMIMDSFALPVEGTETRVNAQAAAYEYMAAYIENAKQVRRRRKRTASMAFCHGGLEKNPTTHNLETCCY